MADKKNIVNIHGKDYKTVAGRVEDAHAALVKLDIETEITELTANGVVFKAMVTTGKGVFNGHSYANFKAAGITGQSPFEVAETSAIGRALGFAGYGIVEGMATGDEIHKSESGSSRVDSDCTCGSVGKFHKFGCPARKPADDEEQPDPSIEHQGDDEEKAKSESTEQVADDDLPF